MHSSLTSVLAARAQDPGPVADLFIVGGVFLAAGILIFLAVRTAKRRNAQSFVFHEPDPDQDYDRYSSMLTIYRGVAFVCTLIGAFCLLLALTAVFMG